MQQMQDVIIIGGGMAGLTLAIQIKRKNPEINILILEKRKGDAPVAAHKIGESTVELAGYYLREVLGLKDYLETHELHKHGLRFYFKSNHKEEISSRVELGPRKWLKAPSYQIDRGNFENFLVKANNEMGNTVILGARVTDFEIGAESNTVKYVSNGETHELKAKWIVDASSRVSLFKRKLGFGKAIDHPVNSVWWRMKGKVELDTWSENKDWATLTPAGLRYLSTAHFLDKGYWMWIIPLSSQNTSIGIVSDPRFHPFENFMDFETSMEWVKENEPLLYNKIDKSPEAILDFKRLAHFAHHTTRLFDGKEKWGITGEAGAFLDPFYSPGADLIALNNTFLADLILRDFKQEDTSFTAEIYEQTYLGLIDSWTPIYMNKYALFGSPQIMVFKIFWDWAVYWSIPAVLFTNDALTDLAVLKNLFASSQGGGRKFGKLLNQVQQLLLDWLPYENRVVKSRYVDPFDHKFMCDFQESIETKHGDKLLEKIADNLMVLEKFAAEIFRKVSAEVKGTDMNIKVNPYTMRLDVEDKLQLPEVSDADNVEDLTIREEVARMWLTEEQVLA